MGVGDADCVDVGGGFVGVGGGEGCVEEGEREGVVVAAGCYQ